MKQRTTWSSKTEIKSCRFTGAVVGSYPNFSGCRTCRQIGIYHTKRQLMSLFRGERSFPDTSFVTALVILCLISWVMPPALVALFIVACILFMLYFLMWDGALQAYPQLSTPPCHGDTISFSNPNYLSVLFSKKLTVFVGKMRFDQFFENQIHKCFKLILIVFVNVILSGSYYY